MTVELEELSMNAWPALQTVHKDGWLLRTAEGYTKRANSVSPLYGACLTEEPRLDGRIRECEALYESKGLRTVFKLTPFSGGAVLDEHLARRGYELVEPSLVMTTALADMDGASHPGLLLEETFTDEWTERYRSISGSGRSGQAGLETMKRMIRSIPSSACFASITLAGEAAACGFAVREGGYAGLYNLITAPAHRGRGHAEQLVRGLLQWARQGGAHTGYVQVVAANAPAVSLYRKLGYEERYGYWYRVQPRIG